MAYFDIRMKNESNTAWSFVVYQKPPVGAESLAWLASPFHIDVGSEITFAWNVNYQFVWASTGILKPGINFSALGLKDCDIFHNNMTYFTIKDDGPGLSDAVFGADKGSLKIVDGHDVPLNKYSVGVAMSQNGLFAVNAGPNLTHVFIPTPSYWVAAMIDVKQGDVLDIKTITRNMELRFPLGVASMTATLKADNTWVTEPN